MYRSKRPTGWPQNSLKARGLKLPHGFTVTRQERLDKVLWPFGNPCKGKGLGPFLLILRTQRDFAAYPGFPHAILLQDQSTLLIDASGDTRNFPVTNQ